MFTASGLLLCKGIDIDCPRWSDRRATLVTWGMTTDMGTLGRIEGYIRYG